jgi:uncharacterized membrane protein
MNSKLWIFIALACLVVGGISFTVGRRAASAQAADPVGRWLALSPEQTAEVQKDDAPFAADMQSLGNRVRQERQKLADLLESASTPDGEMHAQLQRALDADAALQRRVLDYVLRVRPHLSAEQQRQLLGLCAQGFRGGMGYGGGRGPGMGLGRGPGGGGGGMGRGVGGPGRGMGRGPWWQQTPTPATKPAATQSVDDLVK